MFLKSVAFNSASKLVHFLGSFNMMFASFAIVVLVVAKLFAAVSMQKITVLLSKAPKFHDDAREMSAFERLERRLIESFANHYKLDIEYIEANDTLNGMFGTENELKNLLDSIKSL